MKSKTLNLTLALSALALTAWAVAAPEKTHLARSVSTRKMADSVHAVIAADQRVYAETVARLEGAPGHAELLRQAGRSIQTHGAEFSYALRSLQPIVTSNGPQTEAEQTGLAFVAAHPGDNYYTEEELGGRSYFTAIYAERATAAACVDCHNANPRSPRRDLKLGDVMGGIVVRVPLEF
jgi:hypothetical protein